jgi:hypothetical protein
MSEKKPDIVVWSEDKGYYAKTLTYGTDLAAPAIKPNIEEVTLWKQTHLIKVNHYFESQFNELKEKYKALIDEFRWNELIYNAKYSFEPVLGETYYLYSDDTDNPYLSLINPNEWKSHPTYIGAFRLDSGNKWEKVD